MLPLLQTYPDDYSRQLRLGRPSACFCALSRNLDEELVFVVS